MPKFGTVEMSEKAYAALWGAIVKTGDKDTLSLWKEVTHKQEYPLIHFTIAKDLYFGFLDDIRKYNCAESLNLILSESHPKGYFLKHCKQ